MPRVKMLEVFCIPGHSGAWRTRSQALEPCVGQGAGTGRLQDSLRMGAFCSCFVPGKPPDGSTNGQSKQVRKYLFGTDCTWLARCPLARHMSGPAQRWASRRCRRGRMVGREAFVTCQIGSRDVITEVTQGKISRDAPNTQNLRNIAGTRGGDR